jgi:hypothetical protein
MSLMVIFARPAQAHHPILRVESVCNVETGDIEVTWFLANGNWQGRNMTVDQVTYTDGTGGFSNIVVGKILGPNASTTDVIVYPFSASDTKTLTVRADWDGGGPQDVERSESIDLSKVDRSECQPPEIKPSKIVVKKEVTEGSDTAQSFVFTASYDGDGFSLSHGDSNDSGDLTAGTYSVSEDGPPSGWTLQSAKCVSTDEGDDSTPADINVSEGETVTCTFVNHEKATPPPPPPPPPTPLIETAAGCELATSKFVVSALNVGSVDVLVGIVWDSGSDSDDLKPGERLSAVVPVGENWTIFEENVPVEQGLAESCDEVSPTSIIATTTPEVAPTVETLPFTGAESGTSAAWALVLMAGGALALVGARSVRADTDE